MPSFNSINSPINANLPLMDDPALADTAKNRAAHTRELEEKAAHLERENAQRREEKAAEERLHRAEKESEQLQHPSSLPWPLNLLHSQAENEGGSIVAVADSVHDVAFDVNVAQPDGGTHGVEVAASPADDRSGQDGGHVVDHSHDAVTDPSATA